MELKLDSVTSTPGKRRGGRLDGETVERIVEAAEGALPEGERLSLRFVAVQGAEGLEELARLEEGLPGGDPGLIRGASAVVVVLERARPGGRGEPLPHVMSALMGAAAARGVDSRWTPRAGRAFACDAGRALLAAWGLPSDGSLEGVGCCVLGGGE